ncbi:hypothetical protein EJB05_25169, partial [Eragrostis curvula]
MKAAFYQRRRFPAPNSCFSTARQRRKRSRTRMAPRRREKQVLASLCDLVTASLLPYLEPGTSPPRELTREDERRLLVELSRVNKAIRGWDEEEEVEGQGSESDGQETGSCSGKIHGCCLPRVHHLDDGFDCLRKMVSVLVGFLGFSSDYVKHSARNILVSMSISLTKFDTWIQFIEFIWAAIHASSTCVHKALPSKMGLKSHDIASTSTSITSFMAVLKLHSCVISGQMMASLFQVLHAMLKFLKHNDSELKGDFICLSIHHIQKMPWESVHQLGARELVSDAMDSKFSFCHNLAESGSLTGSLLQLLCSLLEQTSLEGTDGQDMYVKLVDIVPKLAAFLQEQHDGPRSLYQYSKHKVLVQLRLRIKRLGTCKGELSICSLVVAYVYLATEMMVLFNAHDDMLFRILLQLLDSPLISMRMDSMEATELIGAKLFSSIFDPVHLFHLLLLLLDYDHLVLVDYLISKDVGVDCAQYLLRCLRLVSQSWHAFVDGSVYETKIINLNSKRQKTSQDANGAKCSSSKERMNAQKLFISAKACLLSLKRTVEDLQKKGLFPYNPRPLLRSLARFEELCEQG